MGFINILVEKSNKGSEMKWEFLVVSVLLMFVVFLAIKYQKESWKKALVYSSIVSFAFATAACAFSDIFDMVFSLMGKVNITIFIIFAIWIVLLIFGLTLTFIDIIETMYKKVFKK